MRKVCIRRDDRRVRSTKLEGDHDVFGDGTTILKPAFGHTQGHQVLFLNLPRTGPLLLAGDLYHYRAERAMGKLPTFEFNKEETRAARADIEAFIMRTKAQLWIQHDLEAFRNLKKAPDFYD